jgi:hypothetical protein
MAVPPRQTTAQIENSIRDELGVAGSREAILRLEKRYQEFMAEHFPEGDPRALKHGYAFRLSAALARTVADSLRADFPGVLPDRGRGSESAAPVASGFKKLDVNYSTVQLGLALGVSIKTLNFADEGSGRFTKNATRIDGELRAEAQDYHRRQPYCVMIALVFVPRLSVSDPGARGRTSFRHIYEVLSKRAGREAPSGPEETFEKIYLSTYESDENAADFGHLCFTEVTDMGHAVKGPDGDLTFDDVIREIGRCYLKRNPQHRLRG